MPILASHNNFLPKPSAQASDKNESELNFNGHSRLSLELINLSHDSNLNLASSFVALKNNFIDETASEIKEELHLRQKFSQGQSMGKNTTQEGKKKSLFK